MKRQVLVPLDGSPLAESILPHAVTLARLTSCGITLLRAAPPPVTIEPIGGSLAPYSGGWDLWDHEAAEASDYLCRVSDLLRETGLTLDMQVVEEQPADAIISCAQDPNVSLVAMATHGRVGWGSLLLGSVAESVLHTAPRPLLLARPTKGERTLQAPLAALPSEGGVYRTVVVPLDGSPFAEHALGWAQALALEAGATLLLVSVVNGRGARPIADKLPTRIDCYLHETAARLQAEGLEVQSQVVQGDPAEKILRASSEASADLIVMSTHGRSALQRLWLGSVAMEVVRHATLPVLLIRPRERPRPPAGAPYTI
jgi:nucleotide-binding universal stress UspA family protein